VITALRRAIFVNIYKFSAPVGSDRAPALILPSWVFWTETYIGLYIEYFCGASRCLDIY
jgi:hypothetical protein